MNKSILSMNNYEFAMKVMIFMKIDKFCNENRNFPIRIMFFETFFQNIVAKRVGLTFEVSAASTCLSIESPLRFITGSAIIGSEPNWNDVSDMLVLLATATMKKGNVITAS